MLLAIFFSKDYYYLQSRGLSVDSHHHVPLQLSLAEPDDSVCWGERSSPAFLVGRDHPHALDTQKAVMHTFLLNPTHPQTRTLNTLYPTWTAFAPPDEVRASFRDLSLRGDSQPLLDQLLDRLLDQLIPAQTPEQPLDERIAEVVDYIDSLEQKKVGAAELAERIALSESRFLHLFKDELELTVRSYLLWAKTRVGARLVVEGSTITEAAHQAGFTDSAHFSRVFRRMFGTTLSSALAGESAPRLVISQGLP